jgi:hypothetical protein
MTNIGRIKPNQTNWVEKGASHFLGGFVFSLSSTGLWRVGVRRFTAFHAAPFSIHEVRSPLPVPLPAARGEGTFGDFRNK